MNQTLHWLLHLHSNVWWIFLLRMNHPGLKNDWSAIFLGRCSSRNWPLAQHFQLWPPSHFSHIPQFTKFTKNLPQMSHLERRSILETELRGSSGSFIARVIHLVMSSGIYLASLPKKHCQIQTSRKCCCELSKGLVSHLKANSENNGEPGRARESKREPERAREQAREIQTETG